MSRRPMTGRWSMCGSTGTTTQSGNCDASGIYMRRSARPMIRCRACPEPRRVTIELTLSPRRKRHRILAGDPDPDDRPRAPGAGRVARSEPHQQAAARRFGGIDIEVDMVALIDGGGDL